MLKDGDTVRIIDVHKEDAYYNDRYKYIGSICTIDGQVEDTLESGGGGTLRPVPGYVSCGILLDEEEEYSYFFHGIKLEKVYEDEYSDFFYDIKLEKMYESESDTVSPS